MRSAVAVVVVGLLALAPTALAGSQPVVYYFEDSEEGSTSVGQADSAPPPENASASSRLIALGSVADPAEMFVLPEHALRELRGNVIGGAWIGDAAKVDANLTAVLYAVADNGSRVALAHANHSLMLDFEDVPGSWVALPENESAEATVLAAAARAANATKEPPVLFSFGAVSYALGTNESLSVGLFMGAGSGGLALGAATMEYASLSAPSFVLIPWFTPDPEPEDVPATVYPEELKKEAPKEETDDAMEDEEEPAMSEDDEEDAMDGMDDDSTSDDEAGESKDTPISLVLLPLSLAGVVLLKRRR